jgi:hypothetical protein
MPAFPEQAVISINACSTFSYTHLVQKYASRLVRIPAGHIYFLKGGGVVDKKKNGR